MHSETLGGVVQMQNWVLPGWGAAPIEGRPDLLLWIWRISGGQALPLPFVSREFLSSIRAEGLARPAKRTAVRGVEK